MTKQTLVVSGLTWVRMSSIVAECWHAKIPGTKFEFEVEPCACGGKNQWNFWNQKNEIGGHAPSRDAAMRAAAKSTNGRKKVRP